jgi:hypothetical protein
MVIRSAVVLMIVGGLLFLGGSTLAIAFHNYTIFGLPVTSTRDVAGSATMAGIGLFSLVVGAQAVVRAKRRQRRG